MFQWKNAALAAAALLCLAGCDTPIQTVAGNYSDAPGSIGLILSDQRPPDEGKHEMMSRMPGSCGTGVVRLQDEVTKPSRVAILRQDLETALGAKMANKAIILSHYTIFYNTHAVVVGTNPFDNGLLGHALVQAMAGSGCFDDIVQPGSYMGSEVDGPHSPFVISIAITVDGKDYSQRTVYVPKENLPYLLNTPYSSEALLDAIHRAHAGLIAKLQAS
jgi:hypothetical protein